MVQEAFEAQLGIAGKIPDSAKVIGLDEAVVKTVVGTPRAPESRTGTFLTLSLELDGYLLRARHVVADPVPYRLFFVAERIRGGL